MHFFFPGICVPVGAWSTAKRRSDRRFRISLSSPGNRQPQTHSERRREQHGGVGRLHRHLTTRDVKDTGRPHGMNTDIRNVFSMSQSGLLFFEMQGEIIIYGIFFI